MKKKKQILILLIILLGLGVCYLAVGWIADMQESKESQDTSMIDITKDEMVKIECSNDSGNFAFEKKDGSWKYAEDASMPVKQKYVDKIAKAVASVSYSKKMKDHDDLSYYGLDEPECSITVTADDGTGITLEYGDTNDNYEYYATTNDGSTVFTTDGGVMEKLPSSTDDFLKKETFPDIDSSSIKSLTIKKNGEEILSCSTKDKDDETLTACGMELSQVDFDTCVTYDASEKELNKYGLSDGLRRECRAEYKSGEKKNTVEFYMSDIVEKNDDKYVYIQLKGSKMVYEVDAADMETITR